MRVLASFRAVNKNESNKEKIEYIYDEYRHLMLNKALNILKDQSLAEQALYDSFIHISKNIKQVGDPRSSHTIVLAITIAKNCAYALLGGAQREFYPEKENKNFNAWGIEEALYEMSVSDIVRAVNKLGGENKNIFLLKYAFGFSQKKIAGTLNENDEIVAARLQKAQKRLRAILLRGRY